MITGRHKGTGIAPIAAVLQTHPRRDQIVPAHLRKYLDQPVLVSAWYPESEYFELLEILSKAFDRKDFGGEPWTQMGLRAAQRDIGGLDAMKNVPRSTQLGIYKHYVADDGGLEAFFRRAAKVWTQYHDSGRYDVVGKVPERNAVIRRLSDFYVPIHSYTRLQAAYVQEYARLVGINMNVTVLRSTAKGDPHCEWMCSLERSEMSEAYVASVQNRT